MDYFTIMSGHFTGEIQENYDKPVRTTDNPAVIRTGYCLFVGKNVKIIKKKIIYH